MQRIDPRLPLLWRTPSEIQLGFASPRAVLVDLTPAEEYVVSALHSGVSDLSLRALGAQRGMSAADLSGLLRRIAPALEPPGAETFFSGQSRAVSSAVIRYHRPFRIL
jgi:hypothetical protein